MARRRRPLSRRSPTRRSCPSPPAATSCWPPSATTRSWWWRARPARARAPSSPSCASSWAAACRGLIGHTQPRRLAARTVAERVAEELGTEVGDLVGYTVRFTDRVGERTLVKVMTDGILLAEIQRDRLLRRYDTLIVDEAHERSLNIDFLLGYLTEPAPPPARPQADRHLGHHRHRALLRPLRRPGRRGVGPHLPGRGPLPAARRAPTARPTRSTASAGRSTSCGPRGRATCSCSSAASGRSATPPTPWARPGCPTPSPARSTPGCRPPSSTGSSSPTRAGASCWPPTWPRRRSPCPASATSSTPARPASPATTAAPRSSACPSSRSPRRRPTSGPGAAGGWRPASASASTPRTTTTPGPSSPSPRSCAPTWPRSSSRWRRSASATSRRSRSSTRPTPAPSATAWRCWRSWAPCGTAATLTPLGRRLARLPVDPRLGRMVLEADRQRLRARGAGHRRRPVDPGPARAADRRRRPRPTSCTPASPTPTRTSWPSSTCGATWRPSSGPRRRASSGGCAGPSTSTTCGCASGRTSPPAPRGRRRAGHPPQRPAGRRPTPSTGRCWPACCRTSACTTAPPATTWAPARPASLSPRARSLHRRTPAWVMAAELVETNRLWARMVARIHPEWIEQLAGAPGASAATASPGGTPSGARPSTTERVTLYGLPIVDGRRVQLGAGRPGRGPAACSSSTPWSTATGRRRTASRPANARAARRGAGAGGPGPAPRPAGGRRPAGRVLRRAARPDDVASARHFDRWWNERPARATPTC